MLSVKTCIGEVHDDTGKWRQVELINRRDMIFFVLRVKACIREVDIRVYRDSDIVKTLILRHVD